MLQAYSLNLTTPADTACSLNNVSVDKGKDIELLSPATIRFNTRGVYKVSCDASAAAATTLQLYKDGVAMPQAQSTGTNPSFTTFVQVPSNNTNCCCSSPTTIQLMNTTAADFTNLNICVEKIGCCR